MESLTMLAPPIVTIAHAEVPAQDAREAHERVVAAIADCGYLPRLDLPFEQSFYAATTHQWIERYREWVQDPVRHEMYRVRSLFDLRAVCGRASLWHEVAEAIRASIDRAFVHILANDCLARLPPLTFFQDAVIDSFGEHTTTFKLEESALRPLVDVGRVFALAAHDVIGRSTVERFGIARSLVPEREAIFREAADTFRIVLWQQGRVGIAQGTRGAELPASLLSRHDRQVLKGGFRSILQLLEFTAALEWLDAL
jgi:signal-transduction protein with cAMP-binding, CBS, and nucleotidyltransferase domain